MEFYEHKVDDIRKDIVDFSKGSYGKTIFLLAFTPCLMLLMITIIIELMGAENGIMYHYTAYLPILILLIILSFVLGNIYYYTELRRYLENKEESLRTEKILKAIKKCEGKEKKGSVKAKAKTKTAVKAKTKTEAVKTKTKRAKSTKKSTEKETK